MTNNPVADLVAREITMIYRNYRGEIAERTVTPLHIWWGTTDWHPEPGWLMTAFDHDKQADRDFALADCQFAALTPVAASETPDACQQEDLVTAGSVEPVGWFGFDESTGEYTADWCSVKPADGKGFRPLYAHPPTPMSVEAAAQVLLGIGGDDAARAIEAAYDATGSVEPVDAAIAIIAALRALSGEKS